MNPGDKCVCQEDNWHNAYGDEDFSLHRGMRLTVISSVNVGGTSFYSFKEAPEKNFYLSFGFKPMRELN